MVPIHISHWLAKTAPKLDIISKNMVYEGMNMSAGPFNDATNPVEPLPSEGAGRLILCDCNGTLFDARHRKGLNMEVFDFLFAAEQRGYNVIIHSGNAHDNITGYMAIWRRRHERFNTFIRERVEKAPAEPEILYKDETHDMPKPFLTIDDEHGSGYTSRAQHQWEPNDPRMHATMAAWGEEPKSAAYPEPGSNNPPKALKAP